MFTLSITELQPLRYIEQGCLLSLCHNSKKVIYYKLLNPSRLEFVLSKGLWGDSSLSALFMKLSATGTCLRYHMTHHVQQTVIFNAFIAQSHVPQCEADKFFSMNQLQIYQTCRFSVIVSRYQIFGHRLMLKIPGIVKITRTVSFVDHGVFLKRVNKQI